jgi:uncharacterized protein YndB with AHSA1/START domain
VYQHVETGPIGFDILMSTAPRGADDQEDVMDATDRITRSYAASAPEPPADRSRPSGVRRGTGRERDEWFTLLDEWGAAGRPYREIAAWLTGEHKMSDWWAQKLIVEYEQSRKVREPGIRPDGTFTVGTTKTVGVPVERLFEAVVDPQRRQDWLPGAVMRERTSHPGRSARFDWREDGTRVTFQVAPRGEARSQVAVEHERLPDSAAAKKALAFWRERVVELKTVLESSSTRQER